MGAHGEDLLEQYFLSRPSLVLFLNNDLMFQTTIHQRLSLLTSELQNPRLLNNRGIGNEIGYYIFDYDPEHEPIVQQNLAGLQQKMMGGTVPLKAIEINLYQLILRVLEERSLLQRAFELEANKGNAALSKTIKPMMRPEKVVDQLQTMVKGDEDLILITGVGASWPILRSHTILNNLHPVLDETPVVMFFPGSYDGQELRLFNTLKDDNYYRAFPLVPRQEPQV
jgi:Domain of unknown function (DUF1788)